MPLRRPRGCRKPGPWRECRRPPRRESFVSSAYRAAWRQAITTAEQQAAATAQKDELAITTAEQQSASTEQKDKQGITTAEQQVATTEQKDKLRQAGDTSSASAGVMSKLMRIQ